MSDLKRIRDLLANDNARIPNIKSYLEPNDIEYAEKITDLEHYQIKPNENTLENYAVFIKEKPDFTCYNEKYNNFIKTNHSYLWDKGYNQIIIIPKIITNINEYGYCSSLGYCFA